MFHPKGVGVVHPHEAMVNVLGEIDMEYDGFGSDPVLHLFRKRRLFSTEGEGHTSTALVGVVPGDTHTGLSVSFEVLGNKEVMTELPNNKIVEKALVDNESVYQQLGLPSSSKGKEQVGRMRGFKVGGDRPRNSPIKEYSSCSGDGQGKGKVQILN